MIGEYIKKVIDKVLTTAADRVIIKAIKQGRKPARSEKRKKTN